MILTPSFGSTLTLKIPCSTKPAPLFCGFFVRTRQHCLFPVLAVVFPHPLQNRVPRVQVLLPLPKKSGIASAVPDFFVSVRKDSATRHGCALRSACRGVSERQWRSAANRPRRQPRQVRCLSMPVSPPVRTGCTPLQHPERTRFRLFLAFPGAFRCFCPLLTCKIFGSVFVHPAA